MLYLIGGCDYSIEGVYGLPFIDTGTDFEAAIAAASRALTRRT